jgi:rRNA biogenesis protein RRP5
LAGAIKPKNLLPKDAFRVEHLNYKRLVPTTKVLAQVISIRALQLIVSLPNQLLGHVPITNISPEFTKRLEEEENDDDSDEESDEDEEASETEEGVATLKKKNAVPSLDELYKVGDWVSAIVVTSGNADSKAKLGGRSGDENVRAAQRIELSLEPEKVNEGIAKGDLRTGFVGSSFIANYHLVPNLFQFFYH